VLIHDGQHDTGLPVEATDAHQIRVTRFPAPELSRFDLPAVRLMRSAADRPIPD
jgi:hypothetical protein